MSAAKKPFVLSPEQAPVGTPPRGGGRPPPIVPPEDVPEPGSTEFYAKFYPPGHPFHNLVGPRAAPPFSGRTPMDGGGNPNAKPSPPSTQMGMDHLRPEMDLPPDPPSRH